MSKKKTYPCPLAKGGFCEYGGGKAFDYGFMSGTESYCRKAKRRVYPLLCGVPLECPLSGEVAATAITSPEAHR